MNYKIVSWLVFIALIVNFLLIGITKSETYIFMSFIILALLSGILAFGILRSKRDNESTFDQRWYEDN